MNLGFPDSLPQSHDSSHSMRSTDTPLKHEMHSSQQLLFKGREDKGTRTVIAEHGWENFRQEKGLWRRGGGIQLCTTQSQLLHHMRHGKCPASVLLLLGLPTALETADDNTFNSI